MVGTGGSVPFRDPFSTSLLSLPPFLPLFTLSVASYTLFAFPDATAFPPSRFCDPLFLTQAEEHFVIWRTNLICVFTRLSSLSIRVTLSNVAKYSSYRLLQDTGLPDAHRRITRGQLDARQVVKAYRRISKGIEGTYNRLQR